MTRTSRTESNQKLLWYKFPFPFSAKVCVMVTESLPEVLGPLLQELDPNHGISSFLHSVPVHVTPFVSVSGYLSVLLPDWAHMWWKHVLFGAASTGPILLPGHIDTPVKMCSGQEEKVAGREQGAEGDWKQSNTVITTVNLCSEMLRHMIKSN